MLESLGLALELVMNPVHLRWLLLGVGVGLIIGIIPGLGGTVGMAILLPFIFGMDPLSGIAMLVGMAAITQTSDTFPSVLLGVPGSSGSQATIMDGYPLAQRGEAGRALNAAFMVSAIGGVIGAIALLGIIFIARPIVLAFGPPELFMFAMLALSIVGTLTKGALFLGLVSGITGLAIGIVGLAPQVGELRFTFGSLYLMDGFSIAVLSLGLFALPEIVDLVAHNRAIADTSVQVSGGRREAMKDVWRNKALVVRTAAIGTGIGMLPGVGGSVVDWIAYGATVRTSRGDNTFGKGDIRGVIGPESANNAKEGGSLIPTLLFGIPGSGTTAMLIGGLIMLGLQPGQNMITTNLHITMAVIWTLVIANVVGALTCMLLIKRVIRISLIPARSLAPFLLVVFLVGAYQTTRNWGDIVAFFVFGLLGWVMKQAGVPRPPLLIGFVIATTVERYLHISVGFYGWSWITKPLVLVLLIVILFILFGGQIRNLREARRLQRSGGDRGSV